MTRRRAGRRKARPAAYVDAAGALHFVWSEFLQTRQIFYQRQDRFDRLKVVDEQDRPQAGALIADGPGPNPGLGLSLRRQQRADGHRPRGYLRGGEKWRDADTQVLAYNHNRPNADINGLRDPLAPPIRVGRSWSGLVGGAEGGWDRPDGYRILIHEFGHYALGLWHRCRGFCDGYVYGSSGCWHSDNHCNRGLGC